MTSGLSGALSTALTGADAFQSGINVVSQNLSNQSTTGYGLRSLDPQTAAFGSNTAGSGVIDPAQVNRAADGFAAARLNQTQSTSSAATSLSNALTALNAALQGEGDIHGAASTFFGDLTTLASEPTNPAQRQTVMSDAQGVVSAFNSAAGTLNTQLTSLSQTLGQNAHSANQLLDQLASINKQLQRSPNESSLIDQQRAAMQSLSKLLGVSTLPLGKGQVEVLSGGTVLLDQAGAQHIAVSQNGTGAPTLTVGNNKAPLVANSTSGSIGGTLAAYGNASKALAQIDLYASNFAGLVNQSQSQGLTANGSPGGTLFNLPASAAPIPAATNSGSASLSVATASTAVPSLLPTDGRGYRLTYGSGGWTATSVGSGVTTALGAGPSLALAGYAISVSGTANPGDSFVFNPTSGAAAGITMATNDPKAIAAADPYVATPGTISASGATTNTNAGTESQVSDTVTASPASGATTVTPGSTFSFGQTLQLTFSSSSAYKITNASSGATVATGTWSGGGTTIALGYSASGPYWQVQLSGHPAAGDQMTLAPGGANSGSNATRMADLWNKSQSGLTGGSLQGAILATVGQFGSVGQAAATAATASGKDVTAAQNALTQIAGVDPNQQAVLLTEYQQAFQAVSKVIATDQSMFQALIQAVG